MLKRNNQIIFRLSNDELKKFDAMLKRSGVSRQSYLLHFIKGYTLPDAPPPDYYSMMRELYHIGNNLNQIAYIANATGLIDEEKYRENVQLLKDTIENITKAVISPRKIDPS